MCITPSRFAAAQRCDRLLASRSAVKRSARHAERDGYVAITLRVMSRTLPSTRLLHRTLRAAIAALLVIATTHLNAADKHWSFHQITRPNPPRVRRSDWPRNGSDSFVLARLEKENVAPSLEAERVTLMRRVTLDLIGLPPTPEEVAEFLADERAEAYERLADRLLASPHYGERWARPWLDLCHYGDSDGHLTDQLRPVAWRYRDWVTRMLNDNLPFDEFTLRQLAGDLTNSGEPEGVSPRTVVSTQARPGADAARLAKGRDSFDYILGTGFLRQTLSNREGGADLEEFRVAQIVDRTSMVGTIWLGLTVGCARCHDHKYDPLTQKEFFRLYAFFDDVDEVNFDAPLEHEAAAYRIARPESERRRRELIATHDVATGGSPVGETTREPCVATGLTELQKQWEAKCLHAAAHPGEEHVWDRQWEVLGLIWGGHLGEGQLEGCEIMRRPWDKRTPRQQDDLVDYFLSHGSITDSKKFAELKLTELQKQLAELKKQFPAAFPTRAPVMQAAFVPRQTYIHERGDFRGRGADVSPGLPQAVAWTPSSERFEIRKANEKQNRSDEGVQATEAPRLELAHWLVSRDNPLTARVTVNRMWQEFFGRGLVATSDDFGTRGDRPSHPELLDWLAAEFQREGEVPAEPLRSQDVAQRSGSAGASPSRHAWDIKRMHRLIVTSATYRQSSRPRAELATRDPNNVLLARQNSLRVPAETVRDAALAVSGLLSNTLGGPSVFPPQHERVTMEAFGSNSWKVSEGADRYRRGLYTFILRTSPFAQAVTFDAPQPVDVCTRRDRSNTPLQALTLLNDPVFGEMAASLSARVLQDGGATDQDRLRFAWKLCFGRTGSEAELARLRRYFDLQREANQAESAAWTNLASVLLNLHEFITRD